MGQGLGSKSCLAFPAMIGWALKSLELWPPARRLGAKVQGLVAEAHICVDLFKLHQAPEAERQTDHFKTPNVLPLVGGRAGWINSTYS